MNRARRAEACNYEFKAMITENKAKISRLMAEHEELKTLELEWMVEILIVEAA